MKKLSIIAMLSVLTVPAFANDDANVLSTDVAVPDSVESASESVNTTAVAAPTVDYAAVRQEIKDEIKAELKQEIKDEYKAKKHQAEISFPHGMQIGVGVSATSGLNGFIGYANKKFDSFWAKRFGVRFDFATTNPIESSINDVINDVVDDGIDIGDGLTINDGKVDAKHMAAMVDFYPFGDTWLLGGWRLTGGYYMGQMSASAAVAGTFDELDGGTYEFELMDNLYRYTGNSVRGTAEFDWDYRGPYIGTGFDIGLFAGFKIYVDAGVVFTNRAAELDLNIPTDNLQQFDGTNWAPVDIPGLDSVIAETLADAQSDLDDMKYYPMVKVGFMYRF